MGDKSHLQNMLQILLDNAANFSPNNSKVKVFAEQDKDKAILRVADNGIGVPTEVMPHLFEQIVGDDDSPNLHKVFDIVQTHHGTVSVQENKGGGTVFTIEFPLGESDIEEAVLMDDNE
jgi:signal transduction histidine kinase